jgi:hypothetical protein
LLEPLRMALQAAGPAAGPEAPVPVAGGTSASTAPAGAEACAGGGS